MGIRDFDLVAVDRAALGYASLVPKPLLDRLNGLRVSYAKRVEFGRALPRHSPGAMEHAQRAARARVAQWLALELKRTLAAHDDAAVTRVLADPYFAPDVLRRFVKIEASGAQQAIEEAQAKLQSSRFEVLAERITLGRENESLRRQLARVDSHRKNNRTALQKANAQRQAEADRPRILKALHAIQDAGGDIWGRDVASDLAGRFGCTSRYIRDIRAQEFSDEAEPS
ncbi:hypothetical protein [Paraburkholderia tropica]|uniref:hypothetical protein n=1 Tax=Paraburkholderia tropica TaxID=92647 RepID=UPI0009449910|nr:hypothetical protein [Paraburkholderia tropica]RQN41005.1 hypothetical protein EHZ25_01840 [Paraburkholderia tropica]